MRAVAFQLIACGLAALAPLVPRPGSSGDRARAAGGSPATFAWPATFEGRPITPLPLGERDRRFAEDFPGHVGRFSDGDRELVLRFLSRATRRLHPAAHCLRAVGYRVEPLPARRTADGTTWGCMAARRGPEPPLRVCEQIRDATGRTWPDPSAWYWPALLGGSQGPWWSTTVVEAGPGLLPERW